MKKLLLKNYTKDGDIFTSAGDMFEVKSWTGKTPVIKVGNKYYIRAYEVQCNDPVEIDIEKIDKYYRQVAFKREKGRDELKSL